MLFMHQFFWGLDVLPIRRSSRADSRISNLERRGSILTNPEISSSMRMEDFRKSQIEKEQQLRSQYAELYATVDRLQEQIQLLSGKIEEKEHRQANMLSGDTGDSIEPKLPIWSRQPSQ